VGTWRFELYWYHGYLVGYFLSPSFVRGWQKGNVFKKPTPESNFNSLKLYLNNEEYRRIGLVNNYERMLIQDGIIFRHIRGGRQNRENLCRDNK
jgi:hypothetical protein